MRACVCVCVCVGGGGGEVKFLVVSREGGSLYLHLVRRGVIQNLDNGSEI